MVIRNVKIDAIIFYFGMDNREWLFLCDLTMVINLLYRPFTDMTIDDSKKPFYFFYQTVGSLNKEGVPRALPKPGQFIPDERGNYEIADTTLFVQCPSEMRKELQMGTIFACKTMLEVRRGKAGDGKKYYRVMAKDGVWPIGKNYNGVATPKEVTESWDNFRATGIARPYKVETPLKPKTPMAVASGTLVQEIMTKYPCPNVEEDGFYVEFSLWMIMVRNALKNENTMLISPSGSGKTELVALLAKRLGKPFRCVDMASKQDPIASLVGTHRLKNGESKFDTASFVDYIQEPCLINLDEINRPPVQANNILLPLLDSRRELSLDIATSEDSRVIKANKEICFFATANDGAEYTGTNPIDRAVRDRFRVIRYGYPPIEIESALVTKRTKCKKKSADIIVKVADTIRKLHKDGELSTSVSVRHTLYAGELVNDGFPVQDALENSFYHDFQENELSILNDIVSKF